MATITIKELDPVQGLVDYTLDVKPYHTKIVEVLTEYVHTDNMHVTILEQFDMEIAFEYPSIEDLENTFTESGGLDIKIESPDPGNENAFVAPFGYDHVNDTVTVLGDRTNVLFQNSTVLIKLTDDNDFLIHTGSYNIASVTLVPASGGDVIHTLLSVPGLIDPSTETILPLDSLCAEIAIPGSITSPGTVGALGTFGGITPWGSPSAWPVASYDQAASGPFDPAAYGYDHVNDVLVLPGDRTVEYTVGKTIEVIIYHRHPTTEVITIEDTQIYEITTSTYVLPTTVTEQQHTVLGVTNPSLKNPTSVSSEPLADLFVTVTLTPFPILNTVEGYAAGTHNDFYYTNVPGSGDALIPNPSGAIFHYDDFNPYKNPLVDPPTTYMPAAPASRPPPPTPTPGTQLTDTTAPWGPLIVEPNEVNFTGPESNPNTVPAIYANSFVIAGDVTDIFIPGSIVEIVGTEFIFQILLTTLDGPSGNSYLRVIETIPPGVSGLLKIRENLVGFGSVFTQNARSEGSLSTNVVEAVTFSWNDDGAGTGNSKDVIDGYQFLIGAAGIGTGNDELTINGIGDDVVSPGQPVRILYSQSNDGLYTIVSVNGSTIKLNTSLNSEVGGWIEQYTP